MHQQPVYYLVCRGVQTPGGQFRISHVMRVFPTTLDKITEIYNREVAPLYGTSMPIYDLHTLIIDRPADVSFLPAIADQAPRPAPAPGGSHGQ